MKALGRISEVIIIGFSLFITLGCSAFMSFNEQTLSIYDIIDMSKAKINSDVIIHQIAVTHSRFKLKPSDIERLENAGVEYDVIEYMIAPDLDKGKYKGVVIQDPEEKRNIRGYVYIPVDVWGSTFRAAEKGGNAVIALTEGFAKYTDLHLKIDNHLYLDSPELIRYPFIYLKADNIFDLTAIERANLVRYLRNGGFMLLEPYNTLDFEFYQAALVSFKQMICDSFGNDARFEPIPDNHPLFYCF